VVASVKRKMVTAILWIPTWSFLRLKVIQYISDYARAINVN
jgi:hypothetical protein